MLRLLSALACLALPFHSATPGDWPQYRGPDRDGISREQGWSVTGAEESLWSHSVGLGYSSVVVSRGKAYTQGFDKEGGKDVVWCFDALTGEEIWTYAHEAEIWNRMHGGGTLTTPSIDGDRLYLLNRAGVFLCLDSQTGEEIWKQDVCARYETKPPTWGFSASPLVLPDALILSIGKTVALDKRTGKTLWVGKDLGHAYATPIDYSLDGKPALASFTGQGLSVLDLASGEQRFFHEWKTMYDINAATPVVIDGKLFISSGLNHGCALLDPTKPDSPVVFESKEMRTKMSGCVRAGDALYGFDEAQLKCIDLSGAERWTERGVGNGALILADGKLLILSNEGELIVAEASPEGFRPLSRAKVLEGGVYWTTPTLANGLVYCRSSLGDLVCRDHRPAKQ